MKNPRNIGVKEPITVITDLTSPEGMVAAWMVSKRWKNCKVQEKLDQACTLGSVMLIGNTGFSHNAVIKLQAFTYVFGFTEDESLKGIRNIQIVRSRPLLSVLWDYLRLDGRKSWLCEYTTNPKVWPYEGYDSLAIMGVITKCQNLSDVERLSQRTFEDVYAEGLNLIKEEVEIINKENQNVRETIVPKPRLKSRQSKRTRRNKEKAQSS